MQSSKRSLPQWRLQAVQQSILLQCQGALQLQGDQHANGRIPGAFRQQHLVPPQLLPPSVPAARKAPHGPPAPPSAPLHIQAAIQLGHQHWSRMQSSGGHKAAHAARWWHTKPCTTAALGSLRPAAYTAWSMKAQQLSTPALLHYKNLLQGHRQEAGTAAQHTSAAATSDPVVRRHVALSAAGDRLICKVMCRYLFIVELRHLYSCVLHSLSRNGNGAATGADRSYLRALPCKTPRPPLQGAAVSWQQG